MPNIGPMELIVVLVIALVFLGPKRLPEAGASIGKGIREFKDSISGSSKSELDTSHFETAQAAAQPVAQPVAAAPVAPAPVAAAPVAAEQQPVT